LNERKNKFREIQKNLAMEENLEEGFRKEGITTEKIKKIKLTEGPNPRENSGENNMETEISWNKNEIN